jgi:hypothetical protein
MKRTYRYYLFDEQMPDIFNNLINHMGKPLSIEAFGLFQFESSHFTIKYFKNYPYLTVVYKNDYTAEDEIYLGTILKAQP